MTPDQQAVLEANAAFYTALNRGSLEAMTDIWFPADWAECVHPGWTAIRGWEAIRESWRLIFDGTARVAIAATDVRLRIIGDVAWASCLERIASADDDQIQTSLAHATNLFVRHDGQWRMVVHHASIVPHLTPHVSAESTLVN
jgi:ketosteroid isomerase-like protein